MDSLENTYGIILIILCVAYVTNCMNEYIILLQLTSEILLVI